MLNKRHIISVLLLLQPIFNFSSLKFDVVWPTEGLKTISCTVVTSEQMWNNKKVLSVDFQTTINLYGYIYNNAISVELMLPVCLILPRQILHKSESVWDRNYWSKSDSNKWFSVRTSDSRGKSPHQYSLVHWDVNMSSEIKHIRPKPLQRWNIFA